LKYLSILDGKLGGGEGPGESEEGLEEKDMLRVRKELREHDSDLDFDFGADGKLRGPALSPV